MATIDSIYQLKELKRQLRLSEEAKAKSFKSASLKKNISDIFQCLIWFNTISKQAMLCPHWSKVWCQSWIFKWLNERKSECPNCRNNLTINQLVNCRFASELTNVIDDIPDQGTEKWPEHDEELKYFCKTCQIPICSDCAMIDIKHKDHQFEKPLEIIKKERAVLDDKLDEI